MYSWREFISCSLSLCVNDSIQVMALINSNTSTCLDNTAGGSSSLLHFKCKKHNISTNTITPPNDVRQDGVKLPEVLNVAIAYRFVYTSHFTIARTISLRAIQLSIPNYHVDCQFRLIISRQTIWVGVNVCGDIFTLIRNVQLM